MRNLIRRVGRGRLIAAAIVVVTSGLLVGITRMVFFHHAESVSEPGIVLTGTPRVTSSQSSTSDAPEHASASGGAGSTEHNVGSDAHQDVHDAATDSSVPSGQGHVPQAVDPDPPVAVDHGVRQPVPSIPSAPAVAGQQGGHDSDADDDDDDKKLVRTGSGDSDGDNDIDDD